MNKSSQIAYLISKPMLHDIGFCMLWNVDMLDLTIRYEQRRWSPILFIIAGEPYMH